MLLRDAPEENRYELRDGDELVGFADYRKRPGQIIFTHTEIDPKRREQGLGTQLIEFAVNDARAQGLEIVPVCPFVKAYLAT